MQSKRLRFVLPRPKILQNMVAMGVVWQFTSRTVIERLTYVQLK
jgi:hypothetical protein